MSNNKVKIISGWSNPGGSTIAFINLCNLFNDNDIDCTLYGPHPWIEDKCKSAHIETANVNEEGENLILHYLQFPDRPPASNRVIFNCHETVLYPIKEIEKQVKFWDQVCFVSDSQRKFHDMEDEKVIPNVVSKLKHKKRKERHVAGVIGSLDVNKRPQLSVEKALAAGYDKVLVYGAKTDEVFFERELKTLFEDEKVEWKDHCDDKQKMYDSVDAVFHSSMSETFNFIKPECEATGVEYFGMETAESGAEYWSDDKILEAWKECFGF